MGQGIGPLTVFGFQTAPSVTASPEATLAVSVNKGLGGFSGHVKTNVHKENQEVMQNNMPE